MKKATWEEVINEIRQQAKKEVFDDFDKLIGKCYVFNFEYELTEEDYHKLQKKHLDEGRK